MQTYSIDLTGWEVHNLVPPLSSMRRKGDYRVFSLMRINSFTVLKEGFFVPVFNLPFYHGNYPLAYSS